MQIRYGRRNGHCRACAERIVKQSREEHLTIVRHPPQIWSQPVANSRIRNHPRAPDERAELIAALHQVTGFAEGLLALTRQLLESLEGTRERPPAEDLSAMRAASTSGRRRSRAFGSGSCQ